MKSNNCQLPHIDKNGNKFNQLVRKNITTIKDIAVQAQVSATTVSHALNPQKRHLVAPETVQKVKAIANN